MAACSQPLTKRCSVFVGSTTPLIRSEYPLIDGGWLGSRLHVFPPSVLCLSSRHRKQVFNSKTSFGYKEDAKTDCIAPMPAVAWNGKADQGAPRPGLVYTWLTPPPKWFVAANN